MPEDKKPKLAHRDDLPFEVAEAMTEELQKLHPGCEVRFAGDGNLPKEIQEKIEKIAEKIGQENMRSIAELKCVDCGEKLPGNWPDDDAEFPDGWAIYYDGDEPQCLVCPKCEQK